MARILVRARAGEATSRPLVERPTITDQEPTAASGHGQALRPSTSNPSDCCWGLFRSVRAAAASWRWAGGCGLVAGGAVSGWAVAEGAAGAEELFEYVEGFLVDAVPAPGTAAFADEDAGLDEDFEVVAEAGLGHVELVGEVAEAGFAAGGLADEADELHSDGVGEGLEQAGGVVVVEGVLAGGRVSQSDHPVPSLLLVRRS